MRLAIDDLYDQFLPRLENLEKERRLLQRKLKLLRRNVLIITVVITAILAFITNLWVLIPSALIGLTIYTILYNRYISSYRRNYKKKIFSELVSVLGDGFSYDFNGKISIDELRKSGIFHQFTKMLSEDLITGRFDGYSFEMAEANLYYDEAGSKGGASSYIFKGLFFAGQIPFTFPTKIWILSEHGPKVHPVSRIQDDWQKVDMTDIEFEEEYDLFAENAEVAKKLVKNSILQTILDLKSEVAEKDMRLELSFMENMVYISISSTKELFEPPIKKSITDKELFRSNFKFLASTTGMLQKLTLVE